MQVCGLMADIKMRIAAWYLGRPVYSESTWWAAQVLEMARDLDLVVLDAEDREAVVQLRKALCDSGAFTGLTKGNISKLQSALREFADPKPPKPEEPTGLGAVVEDIEGRQWVRFKHYEIKPWSLDGPSAERHHAQFWRDIDVVRVLSEGVQP